MFCFFLIRAHPSSLVRLGPVILVTSYERGTGCPIYDHVGQDLEQSVLVEGDPAPGLGAGLDGL